MSKKAVFDTNIFISYKKQVFNDKVTSKMALSLVVLCELVYSSKNQKILQLYEDWRKDFYKDGLLIVPSMLDFWNAAKKIRALKIQEDKDTQKIQRPDDDTVRLQNDALIAYTISQTKDYFLVTDNVKDFTRLQRVIDFEFQTASDFFN
jgi:predicted nucleic acid-binding protein